MASFVISKTESTNFALASPTTYFVKRGSFINDVVSLGEGIPTK